MPAENKQVAIIGGGPAGMTAALYALKEGARVVLLEKNEKLGRKLYITGKGRCNVTNESDVEELVQSFPRNGRFLYAALRFMPPIKVREMLDALGCPTVVERGKRVFPASQKASDVTRALQRGMASAEVRLNTEVQSILIEENIVTGIQLANDILPCQAVIVATGGLSYPVTGSTGDGYRFARDSGHRIADTFPSLVPIVLQDAWAKSLQGLSLKNVVLTLSVDGKKKYSELGEMLFTHFGISGPLALSASCYMGGVEPERMQLTLDMKPALSQQTLTVRLMKDLKENGSKMLKNIMPAYLPRAMAEVFPSLAGVEDTKACNQVTAQERDRLVQTLKCIPLVPLGLRPYEEAVVTRGGVDVRDINPSTMASKHVKGLYFAGEALDVDGYTGGFNLQAAFSTGALAGHAAWAYINQE